MLSQRLIIAGSLSLSVAFHAAAFWAARKYAYDLPPYAARRDPSMLPTIELVPSPPPELIRVPLDPNELVIGSNDGTGSANEDQLSDQVQSALLSTQNQAYLSRDPQGADADPSRPQRQRMQGLTIPEPQDLKGMGAQAGLQRPGIGIPTFREGRQGKSADPASVAATPEQAKGDPTETAQQSPPREGDEQPKPEAPAVARGQDRPQSDTDSDLFAEEIDVELRGGKLVARSGREVKFARPRLNLAAIVDTATIRFPLRIKVRFEIDDAGTVRKVTLLNSSGSPSVDRAIELSVYDSWVQPSPKKSPAGRETLVTTYAIY
jgi:hypothetical protein